MKKKPNDFSCAECGVPLEFGKDGICDCGKKLCNDCYCKNGHEKHMDINKIMDREKAEQE